MGTFSRTVASAIVRQDLPWGPAWKSSLQKWEAWHPCQPDNGPARPATNVGPNGIEALSSPLGDDLVNHIPRHVGQPEVAAAVPVGEFAMIDSQQVEDGGV